MIDNSINNITEKKILITYVYWEKESSLSNLNFFIQNGLYDNPKIQYNFIIKGKKLSVNFPKYKNIKIFNMPNKGIDFGGYSLSLEKINIENFEYFIFLNDTVKGPFIPRYLSKERWFEYFVSLISDEVKLVGPSKNGILIPELDLFPHIQSMAFATDKIGLEILLINNVFNLKYISNVLEREGKWGIIKKYEVAMSQIIINNGYKIEALMQCENYYEREKLQHEDIHYEKGYFEITLNPVEIMFIKTNRINDLLTQRYTEWNTYLTGTKINNYELSME